MLLPIFFIGQRAKGNAKKAFKKLKFKPKYSFYKLVEDMIKNDLELAKKEKTK